MNNTTIFNPTYSTNRLATSEKPKNIIRSGEKFKTLLFLPQNEWRQGEGGLRTKGYFKASYPEKPLISIITVVFNGGRYLEETIQSVINQTYDNVEYIIIDGGSTDGTLDIIRKYEDQINYWVSEKDSGIYDAMNKGWVVANEFGRVLYIGAGDKILALPNIKDLKYSNNEILYGTVDLDHKIFHSRANWTLKLGNTLHHQALLVPKYIYHEKPFDLNFKVYADYDFNLRLYLSGVKFKYSEEFKAYALPGGLSSGFNISEMSQVSKKNCGLVWASLSKLYFTLSPVLKKVMGRP